MKDKKNDSRNSKKWIWLAALILGLGTSAGIGWAVLRDGGSDPRAEETVSSEELTEDLTEEVTASVAEAVTEVVTEAITEAVTEPDTTAITEAEKADQKNSSLFVVDASKITSGIKETGETTKGKTTGNAGTNGKTETGNTGSTGSTGTGNGNTGGKTGNGGNGSTGTGNTGSTGTTGSTGSTGSTGGTQSSGNSTAGSNTGSGDSGGTIYIDFDENGNGHAGTDGESAKPAHKHEWSEVYKTVHHDAVYETVTEEAWDEEVKVGKHSFCNGCGLDLTITYGTADCEAAGDHLSACNSGYHTAPVYDTIHHDAKTYEECVKEAWDEEVFDHVECLTCGATASSWAEAKKMN